MKTEERNRLECDSDSNTEELLYTKGCNYKDRLLTKSPHYAKKNQPRLHQRFLRDKNRLDSKGNVTRRTMCLFTSINPLASDCPDNIEPPNDVAAI